MKSILGTLIFILSQAASAMPSNLNCSMGATPKNAYRMAVSFVSDVEANVSIDVSIVGNSPWVNNCKADPSVKVVSMNPLTMQGFFTCRDVDMDLTTLKFYPDTKILTMQERDSTVVDTYQCN